MNSISTYDIEQDSEALRKALTATNTNNVACYDGAKQLPDL